MFFWNKAGLIFLLLVLCCSRLYSFSHQVDSMIAVLNSPELAEQEEYHLVYRIAWQSSDADLKIKYGKRACYLAEELNKNKASPLLLLGNAYLEKGKLTLALKAFFEAANLSIKNKDEIKLAIAYDGISNAYSIQRNHNNSITYLKKAIEIFEKRSDLEKLASTRLNLGFEYYNIKKYDSALVLYEKARTDYTILGHEQGLAYCNGNSGMVYLALNKTDSADFFLSSSILMANKVNDNFAATSFMLEYAKLLKLKNQVASAIEVARNCYKLSEKNNITEIKSNASLLLSELFYKNKQYDSAYIYQSKHIALSDSIKNLETVQQMADLRTEYEVSQKQSEIDIYHKKWIFQLIIICSLGLIVLLSAALILVYYSNLRRARKFTRILEERRIILEKQSKELKELNNIKDRFFSIISHDLRGPISSIGGISFLIKESMASDNKALLGEITDYIDQTVLSLSGLLENLLNWAQSQQGSIPYHEEKINLRPLIQEVVKLFTTVAINKNINLEIQVNDTCTIPGDKNSLLTVFRNLISNAFKFTEMGGTIRIRCYVHDAGKVYIEISDTGVGIAADKINRLFDLKEDKSTWGTEREKGFGIGLTLVGEFVKLNNGEISVKSILGKGTTFTLIFPLMNH